MSRGKWVGELVTDIVDSVRHQVVEKPWFGEIVTPSHGGHGQTSAQRLGWDVPGIPVKPEYRPNIDMGHFFGGADSPLSRDRSDGRSHDIDLEPARETALLDQNHEMDR